MIACSITDIRTFMSGLLAGNLFDAFCLTEGSVTTFCTYSVDGTWQNDFYERHSDASGPDAAVPENGSAPVSSSPSYTPWKNVRDFFFSVIKGKCTPLNFKFVFCLPSEQIAAFLKESGAPGSPSEVFGLYMNYRYDGSQLLLTTGTSLRTFTKDRTLDHAWDQYILSFLNKNGIAVSDAG